MAENLKQHVHQLPYYFSIVFNNEVLPVNQLEVVEATIVLDLNRFLPSFRLKIRDSNKILSQLIPFDKVLNNVEISINRDFSIDRASIFSFDVYRRFPSSSDIYDFSGLFSVKEFFAPDKTRAFTSTAQSALEDIGIEIGADLTEVSRTLNYEKSIIQPAWTNKKLISYLLNNLIGKEGSAGYRCFMKLKDLGVGKGKDSVFVFKGIDELSLNSIKYTIVNSPNPENDVTTGTTMFPMLEFRVFDNYKFLGATGLRKKEFGYFDYEDGEYKIRNIKTVGNDFFDDDFLSLSQYFLIDENDNEDENVSVLDTGRNNDFTANFEERPKNKLYRDINSLSKFWLTTWGLEDVYPGDVVELKFLRDVVLRKLPSYVYQGLWMVERVVHLCVPIFTTRLLLTRCGFNTEEKTSLIRAENRIQ